MRSFGIHSENPVAIASAQEKLLGAEHGQNVTASLLNARRLLPRRHLTEREEFHAVADGHHPSLRLAQDAHKASRCVLICTVCFAIGLVEAPPEAEIPSRVVRAGEQEALAILIDPQFLVFQNHFTERAPEAFDRIFTIAGRCQAMLTLQPNSECLFQSY